MIHTAENVAPTVVGSGPIVTRQVPPNFKGSVIARCIKQSFGPSRSSGLNQITLGWEILTPEKWASDYDGKTYDMTSLPLTCYLATSDVNKKGEATDNIKYLVETLLPKLGLPARIDDENPLKSENNPEGLNFEGLLVEIYLSSKEKIETRKLPDGTYQDVLDSRGNQIKRGWEFNMIGRADLLGLASLATEAAENRPV